MVLVLRPTFLVVTALAISNAAPNNNARTNARTICNSETTANVIDPTVSNDCSYPACAPANTDNQINNWRCVHDETFCNEDETFFPAAQVLANGGCSCQEILDYPKPVSMCNTNGVYSPMASGADCVDGTKVCPTEIDFNKQVTSCDLKCDFVMGHVNTAPPVDTYQGCSFPKFDWYVHMLCLTRGIK